MNKTLYGMSQEEIKNKCIAYNELQQQVFILQKRLKEVRK